MPKDKQKALKNTPTADKF